MFAKLTTKIAMRKAGIPSSALSIPDYSSPSNGSKDGNANTALPFANPFKDLQVPKALKSWQTPIPPPVEVAQTPILGTRAPNAEKLRLPADDGRSTIVLFLRHTGCPCMCPSSIFEVSPIVDFAKCIDLQPSILVAEKNFLELRRIANKYPNLHCVAISHASKAATDKWITQIGGAWAVKVIVDEEREVYATWGLGVSTTYHLLNPWTQVAIRKLGTNENIWAREVDPSANRWQVGGCWGTDESKWNFCVVVFRKLYQRCSSNSLEIVNREVSLMQALPWVDASKWYWARKMTAYKSHATFSVGIPRSKVLGTTPRKLLQIKSPAGASISPCSELRLTSSSGLCTMGCREQDCG